MRRAVVVLSSVAYLGCAHPGQDAASAPPIARVHTPTEVPVSTCADDVEALRKTLARINEAASPRIAPGPNAPWPAALSLDPNFAFFLRHEAGRWHNDPFDLAASRAQIQAAYQEERERRPDSAGFLLAADPATLTREVAARLVALEGAGITVGSFNVEVPLVEPVMPPDPQWLAEVGPRLNAGGNRVEALVELSIAQLDRWKPQCGDLSWTFELDGVAPIDRAKALAQRFVDGYRQCECRTSADRWAALFFLINFGVQPTTTIDGDYQVQLAPRGPVVEFAPDEDWGTTIQRLPPPGSDPARVWLVEATHAN